MDLSTPYSYNRLRIEKGESCFGYTLCHFRNPRHYHRLHGRDNATSA